MIKYIKSRSTDNTDNKAEWDKTVKPVIEEGFDFVTEAPIPMIDETNREPEFCAEIISKVDFAK